MLKRGYTNFSRQATTSADTRDLIQKRQKCQKKRRTLRRESTVLTGILVDLPYNIMNVGDYNLHLETFAVGLWEKTVPRYADDCFLPIWIRDDPVRTRTDGEYIQSFVFSMDMKTPLTEFGLTFFQAKCAAITMLTHYGFSKNELKVLWKDNLKGVDEAIAAMSFAKLVDMMNEMYEDEKSLQHKLVKVFYDSGGNFELVLHIQGTLRSRSIVKLHKKKKHFYISHLEGVRLRAPSFYYRTLEKYSPLPEALDEIVQLYLI